MIASQVDGMSPSLLEHLKGSGILRVGEVFGRGPGYFKLQAGLHPKRIRITAEDGTKVL